MYTLENPTFCLYKARFSRVFITRVVSVIQTAFADASTTSVSFKIYLIRINAFKFAFQIVNTLKRLTYFNKDDVILLHLRVSSPCNKMFKISLLLPFFVSALYMYNPPVHVIMCDSDVSSHIKTPDYVRK